MKPNRLPLEASEDIEVAATLCHELNQPLSYLVSSLGLVRSGLTRLCAAHGDQQTLHLLKWVEGAYASAEHIARVVSDVRAQTLREPLPERPLDLRGILRKTVSMVEHEMQRRARLQCDLDFAPLVMGSETRLVQVFLNLLVNAALAIPEGRPDQHAIQLRLCQHPNGYVAVEVADTGRGISDENLERVTEPYFTTRLGGTSMGLGLAVCKRIVVAAGGRLEIEQRPAGGTTVRVILPTAASA
jgi:two-component system, NtrC family, sensor kinase